MHEAKPGPVPPRLSRGKYRALFYQPVTPRIGDSFCATQFYAEQKGTPTTAASSTPPRNSRLLHQAPQGHRVFPAAPFRWRAGAKPD